jgi:hypothetical protein
MRSTGRSRSINGDPGSGGRSLDHLYRGPHADQIEEGGPEFDSEATFVGFAIGGDRIGFVDGEDVWNAAVRVLLTAEIIRRNCSRSTSGSCGRSRMERQLAFLVLPAWFAPHVTTPSIRAHSFLAWEVLRICWSGASCIDKPVWDEFPAQSGGAV